MRQVEIVQVNLRQYQIHKRRVKFRNPAHGLIFFSVPLIFKRLNISGTEKNISPWAGFRNFTRRLCI